jgi:hypothetical protein
MFYIMNTLPTLAHNFGEKPKICTLELSQYIARFTKNGRIMCAKMCSISNKMLSTSTMMYELNEPLFH